MKLIRILLIIFILYISAYSRDILQYHKVMSDRNLDITLDNVAIEKNNGITLNEESKFILDRELNKAKKLIDDGKFFDAVILCNDLENSYSNYYDIYYTRGLAYYKNSDLYYASLDFAKLLDLYIDADSYERVYSLLGNFFETINEYEQTLTVYVKAYKTTNDPKWLFLAGNAALNNGDIKSGNYYFDLCKNSGYGLEGLGDIDLINNQYNNAIANYNSVQYSNQEDIARVQSKISNAYIKKELYNWNLSIEEKNYTNALNILSNISSYSLQYPEISVALGKTYFDIGDYKTAKSTFTKLISMEKDFDEAYAILAQIYLYESNETEAIKILEEGLEYSYHKPRLYETFAIMLYDAGYSYYPDKIISQIVDIYDISDENKISYCKNLIFKKEYDKAEKLLKEVTLYERIAKDLMKTIEYNKVLDRVYELKLKNYYVDIMQLLSMHTFTGAEEQLRIGYIADAYYQLGSVDKAIDILKEAFNANVISINNVLLLRKLLEIRASGKEASQYQKERDFIDIKATEYWEEELKLHTELITDRIFEFVRFNEYDEALAYISDLRNKNYDVAYIKRIESITYGLYAAYLYEHEQYDNADKTVSLAVRRNRNNYDAIAIRNEMEIDSYLKSIGNYNDLNVYYESSATMKEILKISPAYIDNRIKLAESYIAEYNLEGFNIINNICDYINVNGGKDLLLGRIYSKSHLYSYSIMCYDRASKYLNVNPLYKAETEINLDNYTISSEEASNLVNENLKSANALYAASKLYTKIGNYDEAMNVINNAIAIDKNIDYVYQRAYINDLMGKTRDALNTYEYVINIKKDYAAAYYKAAVIYFDNFKDDKTAETFALNYLKLTPEDCSGYKLLGDIYKRRAESYIDSNSNNLLKKALEYYKSYLLKAVWGKDLETRNMLLKEIEYIQNRLLE